ncbi:MAG TPA: 50S ribosomal protein L22 [Bacteroidia bacterium]|nr:50S ribosomal protein L22 [Bacteroidia bacterium]HRS59003.1 50S ribosomal protein L22 [Bacteroidia bacterium]HRU68117.1 50S ribosomal protein L22 [Bacteroidia bacterium]
MKTTAHLKNVPYSPQKMRLVADLIRGKSVEDALNILKYQSRKAYATVLEKLLISAIHNYRNINEDSRIEESELFISKLMIDNGSMLKRLRPAPQGRGYRVRKRSHHITLEIQSYDENDYTIEEQNENIDENIQENIAE